MLNYIKNNILPDKDYVEGYIFMKYRPYSMKKKRFCVWGTMSHSSKLRIIKDYLSIVWKKIKWEYKRLWSLRTL